MRLTRNTIVTFLYRFIALFLFTNLSHAAILNWPDAFRPVLALTGGVAFTDNAGESESFVIDSSTYSYSPGSWQSRGIFGGFLGFETPLYPAWAMQLGLSYYQVSFHPSGKLSQGVDAQSTDVYHYQYDVRLRQLLLEGKFLYTWCVIYHPYFSLGVGAAFNKADDYETDVPPFLTFTPFFGNHSTNSFTYNVGLGIDVDLNPDWRLGVGYRFTDMGKVGLGNGVIDTTPIDNKLSQSHFHVNEVVAQLTFLMN